jgi:tetratricopeptide (TPR) repeat protein
MAYALLPEYTDKAPGNVSALARESASKALELDSMQAEAHTALGLVNVHDWKFDDAGASYRRALQLKPDYPTANQWYGELLFHTARLNESLNQIQKAVDLDPLAPINGSAIGYVLLLRGEYDRAVAETRKGIQLAPSLGLHHSLLSQALLWSGHLKEGVAEAEASVRLDPDLALRRGQLANAYAMAGRTAEARRIVDSLEVVQKSHGGVATAVATGLIGLKDYQRALDYLEMAVRDHDVALMTAQSLVPDPLYRPLRNDPRFQALLKTSSDTTSMRSAMPSAHG